MRALITGGYGFVGRHLAQHLVKCGDDVAVTYLPSERHLEGATTPLPNSAQSMALDVSDKKAVADIISLAKPDAIYHLAARSSVADGEASSFEAVFNTNTIGTTNLLDAIVQHSPTTKFLFVSSAEVYGMPWPGTIPLVENAVFRPISAYGVSKAAADLATFKYATKDGVEAVRVRPFPHIGPGQSDRFVLSNFAKQAAEIKLGKRTPIIHVGNLEVKRDYLDVSDVVRGYREALLNGKKGEAYNLCSGKSHTIGELLQRLLKLGEVEAEVLEDKERVRLVDIPDLVGSYQKAQKEFGWQPRIELDGTLLSMFAFWIEQLEKK
jgi:GDP-4-dehydro-6-deoxy-D-mannose reductase